LILELQDPVVPLLWCAQDQRASERARKFVLATETASVESCAAPTGADTLARLECPLPVSMRHMIDCYFIVNHPLDDSAQGQHVLLLKESEPAMRNAAHTGIARGENSAAPTDADTPVRLPSSPR
jgi:hypothetical protein